MTESEQLTKGSWYYCQMCDNDIEMLEWEGDYFLSGDVPLLENEVWKVLAEVPSYEQWQAKLEENTKLKELLKECSYRIDWRIRTSDNETQKLFDKISQVLGEE